MPTTTAPTPCGHEDKSEDQSWSSLVQLALCRSRITPSQLWACNTPAAVLSLYRTQKSPANLTAGVQKKNDQSAQKAVVATAQNAHTAETECNKQKAK